jgi:RAB protein geranylgeranyltransferase component A
MSRSTIKSNPREKLSDAYVSWTTQSLKLRMSPLAKLSSLRDKSADRTVNYIRQKLIITLLDIFIATLNYTHCVCKKGYYLGIISTMVETSDPTSELRPAFDVIGEVLETFITITDLYEPIDTTFKDNVRIINSC